MNEYTEEAGKLVLGGSLIVLGVGLLSSAIFPENELGRAARFTLPLLVGIGIGGYIHFNFKDRFQEKE